MCRIDEGKLQKPIPLIPHRLETLAETQGSQAIMFYIISCFAGNLLSKKSFQKGQYFVGQRHENFEWMLPNQENSPQALIPVKLPKWQ